MIVYRKTVLHSTVFVSSMDIYTFIVPTFGVRNSSKKMHKKCIFDHGLTMCGVSMMKKILIRLKIQLKKIENRVPKWILGSLITNQWSDFHNSKWRIQDGDRRNEKIMNPLSDFQNLKWRIRDGGRKNETILSIFTYSVCDEKVKRTMIGMKICTRVFGVADNVSVIRFS